MVLVGAPRTKSTGRLRQNARTLYPAKLSRPREKTVGSGVPAFTEATKRENAGMSKKKGSSTSPAKNCTPLAGSVVIVCAGAVAARFAGVVGAMNCRFLGFPLPGRVMVAI